MKRYMLLLFVLLLPQGQRSWAQEVKERATLKGHSRAVHGLAFSADRRTLATAGDDGTVRLWDVETGKERRRLDGGADRSFYRVAFSPDTKLAAASGCNHITLWDAASGKQLAQLLGQPTDSFGSLFAQYCVVAFSPDGKTLASGATSGLVKLWDVAGRRERLVTDEAGYVLSVNFSPDGKTLAVCSWHGDGTDRTTVRLLETATGGQGARLTGPGWMAFLGLWFSPGGKESWVASLQDVRVCDLATGRQQVRLKAPDGQSFCAAALAPDGKVLATACGEWTNYRSRVVLWDVKTGRQLARLEEQETRDNALVFSSDGTLLASTGGPDGTVKLWDVGEVLKQKADR